jgi:hypothetical protein
MARIRTIKPEFFPSLSEQGAPLGARVLFAGMLTEADDAGRMIDSAKKLAGAVFPYDEDITPRKVEGWIRELERIGSVVRYEIDGRRLLALPHFLKHQRISHPTASRLPAPPENLGNGSGEVHENGGSGSGSDLGSRNREREREQGTVVPLAKCQDSEPDEAGDNFSSTVGGQLVERLAALCAGNHRPIVKAEARAVVGHLCAHVDWRVVDEAIGYCEGLPQPPTMPRYLLKVVRERGAERGVNVPPMELEEAKQA